MNNKEIKDYQHEQKLINNPAAVDSQIDYDQKPKLYSVDEWGDPCLVWNSKKSEHMSVPTVSIHRRESI